MRSIFRYPGGKTRGTIQRWILSHKPACVREYREPFVGGGGVFFAVEPGSVKHRWINDTHPGLVAVYEALARRPEDFISRCRSVPPAAPSDPLTDAGVLNGKPQNARLKAVFDAVALNGEKDQAFRYFFVNRTVFGGRVNYDRPSRLYFSKPEGWDVIKGDHLERAAAWVHGTRITHGDFEPLFAGLGEDVWVYADPPYYRNTHFTGNSKLYQDSFSVEDHKRLAEAVRRSPHNVCLSYDDDPGGFVRSLYPEAEGFVFVEGDWAYCGSTNGTKDRGRELLILNYQPANGTQSFLPFASLPEKLTHEEKQRLAKLEKEIEADAGSFVRIGERLKIIKEERLWRQEGTFRRYLQTRWEAKGITPRHAERLIASSDILRQLRVRPIGQTIPDSESLVRELLRLRDDEGNPDVEQVAKVWTTLVEEASGQPVTAKMVRAAVQEARGEEPEEKGLPSRWQDALKRNLNLTDHELQQMLAALREKRPDVFDSLSATGVLS